MKNEYDTLSFRVADSLKCSLALKRLYKYEDLVMSEVYLLTDGRVLAMPPGNEENGKALIFSDDSILKEWELELTKPDTAVDGIDFGMVYNYNYFQFSIDTLTNILCNRLGFVDATSFNIDSLDSYVNQHKSAFEDPDLFSLFFTLTNKIYVKSGIFKTKFKKEKDKIAGIVVYYKDGRSLNYIKECLHFLYENEYDEKLSTWFK